MIVLITGESMLFAGLIGMYLVFRLSARAWRRRTCRACRSG